MPDVKNYRSDSGRNQSPQFYDEQTLTILKMAFVIRRLRQTRVIAGTTMSSVRLNGRSKSERLTSLLQIQRTETWRKIARCYEDAKYNRKLISYDFAVLQVIILLHL